MINSCFTCCSHDCSHISFFAIDIYIHLGRTIRLLPDPGPEFQRRYLECAMALTTSTSTSP